MAILSSNILTEWYLNNNVSKTSEIQTYVEEMFKENIYNTPLFSNIYSELKINSITYDGIQYYIATTDGIKISKNGTTIDGFINFSSLTNKNILFVKWLDDKLFFAVDNEIYYLYNNNAIRLYTYPTNNITRTGEQKYLKCIDIIKDEKSDNYYVYGNTFIGSSISNGIILIFSATDLHQLDWCEYENIIINKIIYYNTMYYFATNHGIYKNSIINLNDNKQQLTNYNGIVYDIACGKLKNNDICVATCDDGIRTIIISNGKYKVTELSAKKVIFNKCYFILGLSQQTTEFVQLKYLDSININIETNELDTVVWKNIGKYPAEFRDVLYLYINKNFLFVISVMASNAAALNIIDLNKLETVLFVANPTYLNLYTDLSNAIKNDYVLKETYDIDINSISTNLETAEDNIINIQETLNSIDTDINNITTNLKTATNNISNIQDALDLIKDIQPIDQITDSTAIINNLSITLNTVINTLNTLINNLGNYDNER